MVVVRVDCRGLCGLVAGGLVGGGCKARKLPCADEHISDQNYLKGATISSLLPRGTLLYGMLLSAKAMEVKGLVGKPCYDITVFATFHRPVM